MKRKTPKSERERLLNILAKQTAHLEWPCKNEILRQLVQEGLVARTSDYKSNWGGREHSVTILSITDAGRKQLAVN